MPRTSRKRRSPASFARKRKGSRKSIRGTKRRQSGKLGDIHSFKGIVNAGIINTIPSSTSTVIGGQYIINISDIPVIGVGGGLSNSFDFFRFNRCSLEFMPRYNMATDTQTIPVTFLTGLDEVPIYSSGSALTAAPTWSSQGDEDATVTESKAYGHPRLTPDYIRGQPGARETEMYKKHVVHFIPTFYTFTASNTVAGIGLGAGNYKANKKQWVNLNFLNDNTGAEVQSQGPDFYGPMYAVSNNTTASAPLYDVKLHYSFSLRRLRGV